MIHLVVVVSNTAELLAPGAYGPGALLRWESAPAIAGAYVEGGTLPLVSGTDLYNIWDALGDVGTWYRTRISDSGGTTFSPYSAPFQAPSGWSGLTVAQLRSFITSELSDGSLQLLLDAARAAIRGLADATTEVTEHIHGGYARIVTAHPIGAITSVTEDHLVLAADDYRAEGYVLTRTGHGTNPSWRWGRYITVVYTLADDSAERDRVQLELVKLDLTYQPGVTGEKIGTWEETFASSSAWNYDQERAAILASLRATGGMTVIDG